MNWNKIYRQIFMKAKSLPFGSYVCAHSISGYCQGGIKECRNLMRFSKPFNTNEAFGMAYVLDTYLDFASEAKEDFVKLSIDEVTNIIKLLKQVSV